MLNILFFLVGAGIIGAIILVLYILSLRRIVPTNEVHIVQRTKDTISFGRDGTDNMGNTYYQIPAWVPKYGVVVSKLPTTVIDIDISNYDAYDKDRLPFVLDIKAFFRISDFNKAATRVFTINELKDQLDNPNEYLEIVIGIITTKIGSLIPFLGVLFTSVMFLYGLGLIMSLISKKNK